MFYHLFKRDREKKKKRPVIKLKDRRTNLSENAE